MLQEKIDGRPLRTTYQEEVQNSSYQASMGTGRSGEQQNMDDRKPAKKSSFLDGNLVELEDWNEDGEEAEYYDEEDEDEQL